jgi:group I intron endonuclease
MNKISGIYKIINKINGKYYIGSAVNIKERFTRHIRELKQNKHHNINLQRAWNKYGSNNFAFTILKICNKKTIRKFEQNILNRAFKTNKKMLYNICGIVGGFDNRIGKKNHNWVEVPSQRKKEIIKFWKQYAYGKKIVRHFKNKYNYGGRVILRIVEEWKNENNIKGRLYNRNFYKFYNIRTKEVFIGTNKDFYKKYNLHRQSVNCWIQGSNNRLGWTISKC